MGGLPKHTLTNTVMQQSFWKVGSLGERRAAFFLESRAFEAPPTTPIEQVELESLGRAVAV